MIKLGQVRREFSWRDYDKFEEWLQDVLETMVEDLKNKDKEIERLIISLQAQEELTMNEHIKVERLHSIIKEVREYMRTLYDEYARDDYDIKYDVFNKIFYEILDKENK